VAPLSDLAALAVTLSLNGAVRQRFGLADLAWTPAAAIAAWSAAGLAPGDVVALGGAARRDGPAPIAIKGRDVVEIDGGPLGTLRARFGGGGA
jgi:2-keto-4-pentenoate hydratase/2-oxohepta-3-ene-1,7-dioic acid hydratase in catechol pathway